MSTPSNKNLFNKAIRLIEKSDIAGLQSLMDNGLPADSCDAGGAHHTLLTYATKREKIMIVSYLLSKGADVNKSYGGNTTALMDASLHGNLKLVRLLLKNGAKVNHVDLWGNTALHKAAALNQAKVIQVLVDARARIDHQNLDGQTALLKGYMGGCSKASKKLMDLGANPLLPDKYNYIACQYFGCHGLQTELANYTEDWRCKKLRENLGAARRGLKKKTDGRAVESDVELT